MLPATRTAFRCRARPVGQPDRCRDLRDLRWCKPSHSPRTRHRSTRAALLGDDWSVIAALAGCGAFSQWADGHTRWGRLLSAPMLSMSAALGLAAGGVLPLDCAAYDAVWSFIMPLAAALFMLESDLTRLLVNGRQVLAAFLLGAAGMVAGSLAAWQLLGSHMGPEGGKLAACLLASYVGGSVNFAAVAAATSLHPACIPGAMAADNVAMAALLALLMSYPVRRGHASRSQQHQQQPEQSQPQKQQQQPSGDQQEAPDPSPPAAMQAATASSSDSTSPGAASSPLTAESAALTLATGSAAVALGRAAAGKLGVPSLHLLAMAVAALCLSLVGNAMARAAAAAAAMASPARQPPAAQPVTPFAGASALGTSLMGMYFATIGASAGALSSLTSCAPLVGFVFIMCAVHWALLAALGPLLRIPLPALLVGSNAAVGGPATAAGMAASKGWQELAQPAMLCGSLGYALGTGAGLLLGRLVGAL